MNTLPYHERYQILNPLASGGMSKLYLARDPRNDEFVVIKIMTPIQEDDRRNRKALERFQREIDIARKLKHPHVLPILDAGYIQEHGRDIPFFITRYIQDGSLANYIDRTPPWKRWTFQQTADAVTQAAESLWYLHTRTPPIVHQDVKPGNFLYYPVNSPQRAVHLYLCDFGISRLQPSEPAFASEIIGTAAYMAPEQLKGHVMPASDQYALAIVACQLLTGKLPLQAHTNKEYAYAHLNELPIPPGELNPERIQNSAVDRVILRALSKEPGQRYATIHEFSQAFEQVLLDYVQRHRTKEGSQTFPEDGQSSRHNGHQNPAREIIEQGPREIIEQGPVVAPIFLDPPDTSGNMNLNEPLPAKPARPREQKVAPSLPQLSLHSPVRIELPARPRMLSWSPDGNSIACTFFSHVPVCIQPSKPLPKVQLVNAAQATILSWSPNNRMLAIGSQGSIHFWDTTRQAALPLIISPASPIKHLHWSSREMLAIWIDDQIILYPLTYTQLATDSPPTPMHLEASHLQAGTGEVLRWSPNGDYLAAGASNGVITCWGPDGQVWRIAPEGPKVTSLAWSADNSLLIAGLRDKQIIGWDIRTRNMLFRWSNLADMPRAVSIARHGRIAVASGAKRLLFGLPQEAAPSAQCAGQLLVSWSPTRRELATLDDQYDTTLIFWHEPNPG